MKIFLAGFGQYPSFAPAWKIAFEKMGHEVFFFDFNFPSHGILNKFLTKFMYQEILNYINKMLVKKAVLIKPDLIVLHNPNIILPDTVKKLKEICWIASYQHDDPFGKYASNFNLFKSGLQYYNSNHIIRELNLEDYRSLGAKNISILETYFVPWIHFPVNSDNSNSVVFVGHAEDDNRIEYLAYLIDRGVDIKIYGPSKYWERYLPKTYINKIGKIYPVYADKYRNVISSAQISLAFYSKANRDDYSYRVFEIPAIGSLLLGERTDKVKRFYDEDKEAVFFSDKYELFEKVEFLTMNGEIRKQIQMGGVKKVYYSNYNIESRIKQFITDIHLYQNM